MDGVEAAKSGHAGLPLGAAPMAYALWTRHLQFNPKNPKWFNRDRFILSAGHGSMLLYSLLHLTGFDLPLSELKRFRQLGSKTPGHPENHVTVGVEMATGPLGQGVAHTVGFAIAEAYLAATYNKPGHEIIDHCTYAICSDGDLMEGISSEAASLAGHLKLGKLTWLYDDNGISIDGPTSIAFTENVETRFKAFDWHVLRCDGNDFASVEAAIVEAKKVTDKPTLIMAKTTIGYGSPKLQGTNKAHSNPFGAEELKATKKALGLPEDEMFYIPEEAKAEFAKTTEKGIAAEAAWEAKFKAYEAAYPTEAKTLLAAINGDLGTDWLNLLSAVQEKVASRKAGEIVLNTIAKSLPTLIGGSADLAESNLTTQKGLGDFQPATPTGKTIAYGVREHAMMAAVNGINLHGATRGYGASFMVFSDYARPSIRLAALMECPSIFIFTHDSIGVGEDGPTHEPVEQVTSLRLIPNLNVIRPADGNETAVAWKLALEAKKNPTLLALSRQALAPVTPEDVKNHPAEKGGYILKEANGGTPKLVLVATGSEVGLALGAKDVLEAEGVPTRVVSLPSWFLFDKQTKEYRDSVIPKSVPSVSVEAGTTLAWARYTDAQVGIDTFGLSAPGDTVMKEFGFTVENVVKVAKQLLASK